MTSLIVAGSIDLLDQLHRCADGVGRGNVSFAGVLRAACPAVPSGWPQAAQRRVIAKGKVPSFIVTMGAISRVSQSGAVRDAWATITIDDGGSSTSVPDAAPASPTAGAGALGLVVMAHIVLNHTFRRASAPSSCRRRVRMLTGIPVPRSRSSCSARPDVRFVAQLLQARVR